MSGSILAVAEMWEENQQADDTCICPSSKMSLNTFKLQDFFSLLNTNEKYYFINLLVYCFKFCSIHFLIWTYFFVVKFESSFIILIYGFKLVCLKFSLALPPKKTGQNLIAIKFSKFSWLQYNFSLACGYSAVHCLSSKQLNVLNFFFLTNLEV